MKYLLPFFLIIFFISCDSNYEYDLQDRIQYVTDDEDDPVIENIKDNVEIQENFQFGGVGGFCYGDGEGPLDATVSDIIIDPDMPSEYDISKFLPEVRSQGKQGSCVAWATGYYLKSFQENYEDVKNGILAMDNEMSPAYIYNQIKVGDCSDGSIVQDALDIISDQGIVDMAIMPYNPTECSMQPDEPTIILAEPNKIDNYVYLDEDLLLEQTKAHLLNDQPVVIAIKIDRSYFGARDEEGMYIYRKYKSDDGGHAMLVVGYNDQMNAFKVVNSWGKDWGNQGFVWIDYKAWEQANDIDSDFKILCEAWVTNDIIIP